MCPGPGRLQPTGGVGLVGSCVAFAGLPSAGRVRQSGRDLRRRGVGVARFLYLGPVLGIAIKSYDLVKKTATIFSQISGSLNPKS